MAGELSCVALPFALFHEETHELHLLAVGETVTGSSAFRG